MPPLYKRYVPPKKDTAPPVPAPSAAISKHAQPETPNAEPKKRKRERTEDEVAERKAKKLRKKGIDPATAEQSKASKAPQVSAQRGKEAEKSNGVTSSSNNEPRSEFAHIKDTKKRHKLEKEARKARIAAEKTSKENATSAPSGEGEVATHLRSTQHEEQPKKSKSSNSDVSKVVYGDRPAEKSRKRKRRRSEDAVMNDSVEVTASLDSMNDIVEKPKKGKKDKWKDRRESDVIQGLPAEEADLSTQPKEVAQPKKRKHKLEAVLQESNEEPHNQEADDDDSHLKKHGGILKKYQKSAERSQLAPRPAPKEKDLSAPEPILLDLAPLPQPEPAPVEKFVSDDSALPTWLAKPTIISGDERESFDSLRLSSKTVTHLRKLGFRDVLPVQKALIPLLLPPGSDGAQFFPGTESVLPDIAVGAPTGSGKTIAYLLPIIESLKASHSSGNGRLKALIVVPTRELVMQVAAVAESLAKGSTIKIGMATGSGAFKDEQAKLIRHGRRYDPEAYRKLLAKADQRNYPPKQDSEEFEQFLDELEEEDSEMEQRIVDAVKSLVDHVPTYSSSVDILVATPGRLLDHLKSTLGFSLAHLEWLILDEADKLLDLQYDGFLETVNAELERPRTEEEQDIREEFLRAKDAWDERKERRVRKVILSATMTRDISKLVALKLKRPRMIAVRGSEHQSEDVSAGDQETEAGAIRQDGSVFELPHTLREYCVPVGDGSEKPLFLTEVLRTRILNLPESPLQRTAAKESPHGSSELENSGSDSDSSSESSSDSSDADSDDSSDSDTSSNDQEPSHTTPHQLSEPETSMHPSRTAMLQTFSAPTILIFTSSNESAARLTHFLKSLKPTWSNWIHIMTRTDSKPKLSSTSPNDPVIVVSTDRAGRGLDALSTRQITHVVQYDVPRSLTAYVHRVGRTARAGRVGEAWTLYSHSEARWLWKEIAGKDVKGIKRAEGVEKVRVSVEDEEARERLAEVVEGVRESVLGGKRR